MNNLPTGTVTFLFTDIEGSTKLAQGHPDQWESLRARHHAILKSAIEENNGYVFQIIGDAFCASFHTAGDAVRAAIKSQIDLHNEDWGEAPIKVRIGINTGTAYAGSDDDHSGGYKGYTAMVRVQRLMSVGHGGQTLVSLATEELIREELPEQISLRDMGEKRLKDLIHAEHIYQLIIPNLPVDFPPIKTLDAYRHNLPIQLTSFIGREKEMEQIAQSISEHRLVTLTGSGGTGKTRLALQVAADMTEHFKDGVWFVELASVSDSELISQTILTTFGISEQQGRTALQILMDYFGERNLLLVLDNCEHLIQASAKLADTLLNSTHSLKILVTSREALGVKGEAIWQVSSLSLPDANRLPTLESLTQYEAVRLFIERATLVQPAFALTNDNAAFVAQICSRLDGIPLAIELATARIRALSVDQIAKRLDDRFRLLTGGARTSLPHRQTMRATLDWSYNLLSEPERALLRNLTVFLGGWTLEAAETVCGEQGSEFDILDLLTQLVDKSLVILQDSRYRMLETTRQYAHEKLMDEGEGGVLQNKHAEYFLRIAEQADKEIHGQSQLEWFNHLAIEQDNFHAALEWCVSGQNAEMALQLAGALSWYWYVRSRHGEIINWHKQIRTLPQIVNYPAKYAAMLNRVGLVYWTLINRTETFSVLEESREIWLKLGPQGEHGLATCLDILGRHECFGNFDYSLAESLCKQSLELFEKYGDPWGVAQSTFHLGAIESRRGNNRSALSLIEKSAKLHRQLGDIWGIEEISFFTGMIYEEQGDFEKARKHFEEALQIGEKLQSATGISDALNRLANIFRYQGNYEKAEIFYRKSLSLQHEFGLNYNLNMYDLSLLVLHQNNYIEARNRFIEYFERFRKDDEKTYTCDLLMACSAITAGTDQPERSAKLYGAAQALFDSCGYRLAPYDQREFERHIQIAREQLGESAFEAFANEGHGLTMEQAIRFALEGTHE